MYNKNVNCSTITDNIIIDFNSKNDFFLGATVPSRPRPPHYLGFIITLIDKTVGRTALNECSNRRRDLYLTTHNTRERQTTISLAGFEPTIPASELLQTHALDHATTGTSNSDITTS